MRDEPAKRPLPEIDPRMQPFWDAARRGVLALQRCTRCGAHRFPAGEICSECLASELVWIEASGAGVVHSFVVVHHAVDAYFAERVPYAVVDVKLAEGPHMTSTIIECAPHALAVGDNVSVAFDDASEAISLPVFRRVA